MTSTLQVFSEVKILLDPGPESTPESDVFWPNNADVCPLGSDLYIIQ